MVDLTREQVEGALQSRTHPIITVLGAQRLRVNEFNRVYRTLETAEEQQDYIRRELGFLGIEFENLRAGYQLGPLDMVSVWAHTMDPNGLNLDRYQRRALAKLAACAYGIRELGDAWRGASKYLHENGDFPRIEAATADDLRKLRERLGEVKAAKDDISAYLCGGYRGNPFNLATSAAVSEEARARLEEVQRTKAERTNPALEEAFENFNSALGILYPALGELEKVLKS